MLTIFLKVFIINIGEKNLKYTLSFMEIFFTDKLNNLDILKELSLLKYISINFEKPTKLKNAKHATIHFLIVKIREEELKETKYSFSGAETSEHTVTNGRPPIFGSILISFMLLLAPNIKIPVSHSPQSFWSHSFGWGS